MTKLAVIKDYKSITNACLQAVAPRTELLMGVELQRSSAIMSI
jgi:hypothetical protein